MNSVKAYMPASAGQDRGRFPPQIMGLKFSSKNAKFVAENPPFWEIFEAKLKLFCAPIISAVGNLDICLSEFI